MGEWEKCFYNARTKEGFILSTPEKWGKPKGKAYSPVKLNGSHYTFKKKKGFLYDNVQERNDVAIDVPTQRMSEDPTSR